MANFQNTSKTFTELFAFTRTSPAWDASAGIMSEFAADTPILEQGLLIEDSRINLLLHSRDLSNAAWLTGSTGTKLLNATGADGEANSASTLTDSDGAATYSVYQDVTITSSNRTHVASIYIKKTTAAASFPMITFSFSGSGLSSAWIIDTDNGSATQSTAFGDDGACEVIDPGGDFYQVVIVLRNTSGVTTARLAINPAVNTDASSTVTASVTGFCVVDFAQIETNSVGATSVLVTGASQVARGDSSAEVNDFSEWSNNAAFTFYLEYSELTATPDGNGIIFQIADGTTLILDALPLTSNANIATRARNSSGVQVDNFTFAEAGKIAVCYSLENDEFITAVNGSSVTTDAEGYDCSGIDFLGLGAAGTGSAPAPRVKIGKIEYFTHAKTAAELEALTA